MTKIRDGIQAFLGWEALHQSPSPDTDPFKAPPAPLDNLNGLVHVYPTSGDPQHGLKVSSQAICGYERRAFPASGETGHVTREVPFGLNAFCAKCCRIAEEEWGADALRDS